MQGLHPKCARLARPGLRTFRILTASVKRSPGSNKLNSLHAIHRTLLALEDDFPGFAINGLLADQIETQGPVVE
jgi:hypothetical protein